MTGLFVNVDVDDMEKAVAFYTAAFELRAARRMESGAFVELLGAPVPIYLILAGKGSRPFPSAAEGRDYARHWTPVHLDFVVEDLEPAIRRAEAAGAVCEQTVSTHPWGRMVNFADPFGNGFCLLQMNDRGYDAVTDG